MNHFLLKTLFRELTITGTLCDTWPPVDCLLIGLSQFLLPHPVTLVELSAHPVKFDVSLETVELWSLPPSSATPWFELTAGLEEGSPLPPSSLSLCRRSRRSFNSLKNFSLSLRFGYVAARPEVEGMTYTT